MEHGLPWSHLRRQRLERRRVLHRSVWSQVRFSLRHHPYFDAKTNNSWHFLQSRFERELESLRKELANAQSQSSSGQQSEGGPSPSIGTSTLPSPFPSLPNSPQLAPHVVVTQPDLQMVNDAVQDAKRPETKPLTGSEDVISLGDSDSAVATPTDFEGSPTPSAPGGLGLYDESRKDQ